MCLNTEFLLAVLRDIHVSICGIREAKKVKIIPDECIENV